jgi:hypothetical protein
VNDKSMPPNDYRDRLPTYAATIAAMLVAILSMIVYAITASRSITWWEGPEYITAAATLGVVHPPGSLLLTILGWIVTKIPLALSLTFKLNLFAGLLAAFTSALIAALGVRTLSMAELSRRLVPTFGAYATAATGAGLGALIFAFAFTTWHYATIFTPYILTAMFTAMIMCALLRWWRDAESVDAIHWLFVAALLFGLDFSVHRTNLLLLPGVFVWLLLRRSRVLISFRAWVAGVGGAVCGLMLHFLLLPMAARNPIMNFTNPDNLSRFWDYVSLKMYGGSWLLKLFPRKGAFWSSQVMDYLHGFAANFAPVADKLGFMAILPLIIGLIGIIMMLRRNWRLGLGMLLLYLLTSFGAVVYFNVPENFFREMDRHYLPSFVIFSVFIAYGAGSLFLSMRRLRRSGTGQASAGLMLVMVLIMLWAIGNQVLRNRESSDRSNTFFAEDFGRNMLTALPPKAILFTGGDNDSYPLWYVQAVDDVRTDVTVLNLNLLNTSWYLENLLKQQPDFPIGLTSEQIERLQPMAWEDTVIAIPVPSSVMNEFAGSDGTRPDVLLLNVPPTFGKNLLLPQDWVLLRIIQENRWRRPLYFSAMIYEQMINWIYPYLRTEGLVRRFTPIQDPQTSIPILEHNLMQVYDYRGYADRHVHIDAETKKMAGNYYSLLLTLADLQRSAGDSTGCAGTIDWTLRTLPPGRMGLAPEVLEAYGCGESQPANVEESDSSKIN